MNAQNVDLEDEGSLHNDFDPGNYFIDTVDEGKFDITEDIYTSLDLNVESVQNSGNSNNDDEFDLEKIKEQALSNSRNSPIIESSDQINNFPEIDLVVISQPEKLDKEIVYQNAVSPNMFNKNESNIQSGSTEKSIKLIAEDNKDFSTSENVAEIESPDYEPMSPHINTLETTSKPDDSYNFDENMACVTPMSNCANIDNKDLETGKDFFQTIGTNTDLIKNYVENKNQNQESNNTIILENTVCISKTYSLPSPFLSSFTPPSSPKLMIARQFKKESSLEIFENSDNYFESDYFEDDNLNSFPQEEVYTDEIHPYCSNENIEAGQGIEDNSNEHLNEGNRNEENVEDIIMNDHNYFNQEQNFISTTESYIKHVNVLNNTLNIFIESLKNCNKIPNLIEKKKDIESNLKGIFDKVDVLKNAFASITSKKNVMNIKDDIQEFIQIESEECDDLNSKSNENNESKCTDDIMSQFDFAILEALKKVEDVDNKQTKIGYLEKSEISSKKLENEELRIIDFSNSNVNVNKENELCKVEDEAKPINIEAKCDNLQKKLFSENFNNSLQLDAKLNEKDKISCEVIFVERPLTKFKALIELAETIVKFSKESQVEFETAEHFERFRRDLSQIFIYSNLSDIAIQTEHSGKIFSERRLKSINEKEKRRLLNDTSDSSDISSEYETDDENHAKCDFPSEPHLNNEEQENILNGIDFSKYLDSSNDDSDNFPNDFSEHLDVILEEDEDNVIQGISDENYNKINQNIISETCEKSDNNNIFLISQTSSLNRKSNLINTNQTNNKRSEEIEKLNQNNADSVDKEIERLLDFKGLTNKRVILNYRAANSDKKTSIKKISIPNISEILAEEENKDSSDGTDSEEEDCVANENTFLIRQNENLKKQLLESSCSSNSEDGGNAILPDDIEDDDDDDEEFDENKPTLVEKFLKTYVEDEEDYEQDSDKKLNGEHFSELDGILEKSIDVNDDKVVGEKKKNDNLENRENDVPDEDSDKQNASSDCEILDKTFASLKQTNKKRKSLDTLLVEDQKRRKNLKISDEIFSLSSDDESDVEERKIKKTEPHRIIRPIMKTEQLTSETKKAQKEEQSRLNRLKKKENILKKAYKEHNKDPSDIRELILDYNNVSKKFITVDNSLVSHLKQHQIDGVKFMYDCCYGSVNFVDEFPGSGCILAHCMGLGKTLQLIALIHTLITHKDLKTAKILILCPKSTVMNWAEEIQRWLGPLGVKNMKVFTFNDVSDITDKMHVLQDWHNCGSTGSHSSGCLLIGYEAFRTLVSYPSKKNRNLKLDLEEIKSIIKKTLLDPGADLVVCDEGHIIKNRRAAISQAVTEIRTSRRIVLTGTPIQNNLKEYYSMVNFIKPSYLGTEKEFANLYANPIKNGQHKDSNKRDIKIMKQRSFVLHSKLSSFVQRREAALLKTFLPQKFEYVLFIPMTSVQVKLYEIFLEAVGKREDTEKKGRNLLTDYTCLRKIWTHPKVLENAYNNAIMLKNKKEKKASSLELASDEDQPDDIYDSQTGLMSVTSDWWRQHLSDQDLKSIQPSNKLQTMFEILRMCAENREKCLIFSAFVAVLNVVEFFMNLINQKTSENAKEFGIDRFTGPWVNGKDYYRLDGKTPKTLRHEMVKSFNDPNNERARVFLISAKAGGQGINLIGANRVIILDTSWNPSNDQQNIFRIFRLGQKKNCYIYRLISFGTMEEKVYSRSVTKQAMSFRVMDEHQIDRHYSMAELAELYTLTKPDYSNRPIPNLPQDNILAHLLRNFPQYVFKYHEHDSLLENKIEQELSEQEKEDAWLAYENEINSVANGGLPNLQGLDIFGGQALVNAMPPLDNFSRSPASADIFNAGRVPVTSTQFFPGYNFSNKNYLDNMFSYFSNTNPLYGGIDLTKSPVYGDSIGSNFLLPNNRPPGTNMGVVNPSVSPTSYPSLENLHIPSSHPNTYSQNLPPYNALYSSSMLSNSLSRFNNTGLENFKRVFENYVNPPSSVTGMYSSNQGKNNQANSESRSKATDINNVGSKNDLNSFRKHSLHPNFSASLASSSSGSMTNSILNAQNRLINQSSNSDIGISMKKAPTGATATNVQKDSRTQQTSGTSQFNKLSAGSSCNSNAFSIHSSKITNLHTRPSKTSPSDVKKTDTVRNITLSLLKNDSSNQNRTSPKTSTNDSNDKPGNKAKQPIQKTNVIKNLQTQDIQNQTTVKSTSNSINKISSLATSQNHNVSNNNINQPKVILKQPTNLSKNTSQPITSVSGKLTPKNLTPSRGRTNSPTYVDALLRKSADFSNINKSKSNNLPLPLSSKNHSTLSKSFVQSNQEGQKSSFSISPVTSKVNKILIDPLSSNVEDKFINAGISISKKSTHSKVGINVTNISKQPNQLIANQLQNNIIQRKRISNPENNVRSGSTTSNKLDPFSKRPKLTPKELAEELSSSLKRIQSSKGLTIVHKGANKGTSSGDVLEVD